MTDIALCMVVMHAVSVELAGRLRKNCFDCFCFASVASEGTGDPSLADSTATEGLPHVLTGLALSL